MKAGSKTLAFVVTSDGRLSPLGGFFILEDELPSADAETITCGEDGSEYRYYRSLTDVLDQTEHIMNNEDHQYVPIPVAGLFAAQLRTVEGARRGRPRPG